jgi:hypothetical protein
MEKAEEKTKKGNKKRPPRTNLSSDHEWYNNEELFLKMVRYFTSISSDILEQAVSKTDVDSLKDTYKRCKGLINIGEKPVRKRLSIHQISRLPRLKPDGTVTYSIDSASRFLTRLYSFKDTPLGQLTGNIND